MRRLIRIDTSLFTGLNFHTWTPDLRISDATGGAPYVNASGFGYPYGGYAGIDVLPSGQSIAAFGEAGSPSGPGGIWVNRQS